MNNLLNARMNEAIEVKRAMLNPIGTKWIKSIVSSGEKVVIIISDVRHSMLSKLVLPEVLKELYQANIPPSDITIMFALGSNRKHTEDETQSLVGDEIKKEICYIDTDVDPVDIISVVTKADRRIYLGYIEHHYFSGYGVAAEEGRAGEMLRNPVRVDLGEVVKVMPIDFIVNVAFNEHNEIIKAVAGHYYRANREGCRFLDQL